MVMVVSLLLYYCIAYRTTSIYSSLFEPSDVDVCVSNVESSQSEIITTINTAIDLPDDSSQMMLMASDVLSIVNLAMDDFVNAVTGNNLRVLESQLVMTKAPDEDSSSNDHILAIVIGSVVGAVILILCIIVTIAVTVAL